MERLPDSAQLVNGIAICLAFYAGYKYGLRNGGADSDEKPSSSKTDDSQSVRAYSDRGELKMILVVRNDLKMGKGKIGAQCGHASVGAYQNCVKRFPHLIRRWEDSGCAKIAVRVDSETELMTIFRAARDKNLNTCMIRDAGRTQIEPNSKTVLAIGPALCNEVDQVTGHLKLL